MLDTNIIRNMHKLLKSCAGNVAIMAAFAAAPLSVMLGGAVDMMRFASAQTEIQGALDSGILAAAALTNTQDATNVIEDYLRKNTDSRMFNPEDVQLTVSSAKSLNGKYVNVNARVELNTLFLGLIGKESITVEVNVAGQQEFTDLEVALVLDISSSMNGTRLVNLKEATNEFIDTVLKDEVKDMTSISIIPFGGTVNVGDDFIGFIDLVNTDVDNDTDHSDGHKWNGCLEFLPTDFTDNNILGDDYEPVPHFWKYRNFNPWCPEAVNEAIFLSNDADDLKSLVSAFTLSDGTGMDIGAAWGLKALSPELRGTLKGDFENIRPTDYNSESLKVLVMMTDGGITAQFRPKQSGCIRAKNNSLAHNDVSACQEDLYQGTTSRHNKSKAVSYFNNICEEAKSNNVLVFTIGFQITEGSAQDTYLKNCPQSISQYYFVEDTNIEEAFSSIAASINGIRLTM